MRQDFGIYIHWPFCAAKCPYCDFNSHFGIYIHWPFCAAKCPYCDFNSHVRAKIEEDGWVDGHRARTGIHRRAAGQ